jgi:hypothetical protein
VQIKWIKCELWTRNKDRWLHQSNQYRETETSDPFALFWYCTRSRTLMQPSQASPSAASCSIGSRHVAITCLADSTAFSGHGKATSSKQARQPHYWRFFCGSPYGHLRKPQGDTWGLPAASEHGQPSPPHSHSQPPARCCARPVAWGAAAVLSECMRAAGTAGTWLLLISHGVIVYRDQHVLFVYITTGIRLLSVFYRTKDCFTDGRTR